MKLKNKQTGEIRNAIDIDMYTDSVYLKVSDGEFDNETIEYHSLAELNEEWEDYEEPIQVHIEGIQNVFMSGGRVYIDYATAKEAELAVRKLKAWKRLKDSKIKFCLDFVMNKIVFTYVIGKNTIVDAVDAERQLFEDMKIIFGGEE